MKQPQDVAIYLHEMLKYDRDRLDELSKRLEAAKPQMEK